ncbi:hypothetical protein [Ramlibacter alkalitolerans]|jgi:hypothetical protein|uniref:Uncharacterized protein n=1 Tax=Ramlibacter alkalitolerans TaxID=2039631 RepID=A0ABS1JP06_9BURK|nr:hypothetical protein [Ramlibacter alkalitolerans]MBL0425989.1 hypothetical protein [Ramlibacter alkalitolerans]
MTASAAPILDAILIQLAAALEKYDEDSERLVRTWLDMDLYRDVSDQMDAIRMYSSLLPDVQVHWLELLIAHSELVHWLWRRDPAQAGVLQEERLADVRARHVDSIAALRERCLRTVSQRS